MQPAKCCAKSVAKFDILQLTLLLAFILALGSAGAVNASDAALSKNIELLDDKGASLGIKTPAWVTAYLSGGNAAVEKLKDYKNKDCFVVVSIDANKSFAVSAANDISKLRHEKPNESFSGFRKEADWWQLVLDKTTNAQTYRAFALWTKEK